MDVNNIPFNRPHLTGQELDFIADAHKRGQLSGDGHFTHLVQSWFDHRSYGSSSLLVHSCTAALEISALLLDIRPGSEVIMPSYTFVSTANAFVLRGATPVFVDICPDTQCIDPSKISEAISDKTIAICVVHYAGVLCDMDKIKSIACNSHGQIPIIEDAAQAIMSLYKGDLAGTR